MRLGRVAVVAVLLIIAGLGLFSYKVYGLGFPLVPGEESEAWTIEVTISFEGREETARIGMFLPQSGGDYFLTDERFVTGGFGLTTTYDAERDLRSAIWSAREVEGQRALAYQTVIRKVRARRPLPYEGAEIPAEEAPEIESEIVFEDELTEEAEEAAENALLERLEARSADDTTFIAALIRDLRADNPSDEMAMLLGQSRAPVRQAIVAANVLERAGIAARAVHGVDLSERTRRADTKHWLEVNHNEGGWRSIDLEAGHYDVPDSYFLWWRGEDPLLEAEGVNNVSLNVAIDQRLEDAIDTTLMQSQFGGSAIMSTSLFNLPTDTQLTYRFLLLIPIGAFLLVIARQIIGMPSFGTFMPVLIALAFQETALLNGILLFCLVVGLGLIARFYMERLKLLLVPRLASVLMIVVILMIAIGFAGHQFDIPLGLSVALFPMVIMTMTIERMSIVWEEDGPKEAFQQAAGSLAIASAAYLVMNVKMIEHLTFTFPELVLVLLAGTVLLGRYTGYRFSELYRFREFAR